jgi:hypothetical protein
VVRTLPSGKSLKVLGVNRVNFPQSGPALILKYQTEVDIKDHTALRREADEIWATFRSEAEQARVTGVVLSANSTPHGAIIQKSEGFNFVFQRGADGSWKCLDDK